MIVAYCCTRNLYKHLITNIFSLLQTNEVEKIYLLIEDNKLEEVNKIKNETKIIIINYHEIIDKYITSDNKNRLTRYTEGTLVRLLIPKIIKEEKVLYLDIDALVISDISKLFNTNISNYYFAGVLGKNIDFHIDYLDRLGLEEDSYINAGVLLFNNKRIRQNKIDDKWLELLAKNTYRFPDQDVINITCKNNILIIDNMYNSSNDSRYSENMKICHYVGKKENWVYGMLYDELWIAWERRYTNYISSNPLEGKIDIIMPAYNAHKLIERSLKSLASQTIKNNINLILIDNASNTGYEEFINKYKEYYNIKCITVKKNRGIGGARQLGLDNATSKYVAFLDTDDELHDEYSLERLYNIIKYNKNCAVVMGVTLCEEKEIMYYSHMQGKIYNREYIIKNNIRFSKNKKCHDDVIFNYKFCNSIEKDQFEEIYSIVYDYKRDNEDSVTLNENRTNAIITNFKEIIKIFNKSSAKKYYLLILFNELIKHDEKKIFISEKEQIKYYKLCNKFYKKTKDIINKVIYNDRETYQNIISFINKISKY